MLSIAQSASKNIPYKESKLTRSLQNCLSSICHVILIANINANENNFEECLSTLQFAERTKNIDIKTKGGGILEDNAVLNMAGNMHGADKMLKKLNEEIAEHKVKIDNMQREHRQKLVELKNILGLEIEMDKLLSNNQKHNVEKG